MDSLNNGLPFTDEEARAARAGGEFSVKLQRRPRSRRSFDNVQTTASTEEIRVDAGVSAVLSELDHILHIKRRTKNDTEGLLMHNTVSLH